MTITYRTGDTRDLIADLPDGSVDLVATSPPFLCLRAYLPADHPLKHAEIGSEPDPATFLTTLLALTAEWGRVLAPHGSIAVELGDTYSGSGGGGGDYLEGGMREGQQQFAGSAASMRQSNAAHWRQKNRPDADWPRPKSLALIPQLYAVALAYGIHPFTGEPSPAGRWLVRNVVWHRPNPAVGALGDKYRPSTSCITVATRSPRRWFDLTAVRNTDSDTTTGQRNGYAMVGGVPTHDRPPHKLNPAGAPPLDAWFDPIDTDLWTITTQPSPLSHYAMWPARLAERLVLSMCPAQVCVACGEPRRRIEQVEHQGTSRRNAGSKASVSVVSGVSAGHHAFAAVNPITSATTIGWTDCGCSAGWRPGHVLDPFAGTGTTLCVAHLHGRDATGFDIDPRNAELVPARMDEVRRNLFGTRPELPGQLGLFAEGA